MSVNIDEAVMHERVGVVERRRPERVFEGHGGELYSAHGAPD